MITIPALKVRQFGVEFYQTSFTSRDIQRLVQFEVLSYSTVEEKEQATEDVPRRRQSTGNYWRKELPRVKRLFRGPSFERKFASSSSITATVRKHRTCLPFRARSSSSPKSVSPSRLQARVPTWECFKFLRNPASSVAWTVSTGFWL